MANTFTGNPDEHISWSNGLTTVMLARIAVAAAELYRSEWHRDFAMWVATRDQVHTGLGCVGFDLIRLPWGDSPEEFAANRQFVVEAVVHAASREVALRLPYYPNPEREDTHRECLRRFALMVRHFDRTQFPQPWTSEWDYIVSPSDVVCVWYGLFRHAEGCLVCGRSHRPGVEIP